MLKHSENQTNSLKKKKLSGLINQTTYSFTSSVAWWQMITKVGTISPPSDLLTSSTRFSTPSVRSEPRVKDVSVFRGGSKTSSSDLLCHLQRHKHTETERESEQEPSLVPRETSASEEKQRWALFQDPSAQRWVGGSVCCIYKWGICPIPENNQDFFLNTFCSDWNGFGSSSVDSFDLSGKQLISTAWPIQQSSGEC